MAVLGKKRGLARASDGNAIVRKLTKGRGLRFAWGLFLLIGLPLGIMAALGPLTAAGIYIEPLRPLWQPWPPDIVKPVIGVAGFAATFAYLCYRLGRAAGYRWGTVAERAAARNVAEGRSPTSELARPEIERARSPPTPPP